MRNFLQNVDFEAVLVIIFLGIALFMAIAFAMENIASVIIGALAGYLTRIIKDNIKGGDVK